MSVTSSVASDDHRLRRHVGLIGLLFTSVGSIIGSGWLFGALNASKLAGPASTLSWIIGGIMVLFIALVYAELGAMFPVSGGVVRYPQYAFGSFASYTAGWITWLSAAAVAPIEVEAALQYATNYLPWLTHVADGTPVLSAGGYGAAVLLMALFCVINFLGVRQFARANNVVVWWKLGIIILVIVAFLATAFHGGNFHLFGGFAPLGTIGIFTSIPTAGIVFSYLGFRQGIELAGESTNPKRNVPIAVIGSVLITMVIYVLLQVAFIGALPGSTLAQGWQSLTFANDFGPLAGVATLLGLGWLAFLLYVDAFVSPADTGMIYTTATSRISYGMARNGNAPSLLARVNGHGVPWTSVLLTFVIGLIFFLPFPGWQKLVGFITSATVLSFGCGSMVLGAIRRELPLQERPFKLPGGDVIPFLALFSSNLIVFWSGWETDSKLFLAVLLGYILLVLQYLFDRSKKLPPLQFKHGYWMLPWFVGLALCSYLGVYGGGTGVLGFGWAIPLLFLFSLLIYWLGVRSRTGAADMVAQIAHTPREEELPEILTEV